MKLEDYFDFSDRAGEIRLRGHRVWIQHILRPYLSEGKSAEEIANDLPTLSLDKIYATILYYLLNKAAITKYMADLDEALEEQRRDEPRVRDDFPTRYQRAKEELKMRHEQGVHESPLST